MIVGIYFSVKCVLTVQKPEARQHSDFFATAAGNLERKHYLYFTEEKTMIQKSYEAKQGFQEFRIFKPRKSKAQGRHD